MRNKFKRGIIPLLFLFFISFIYAIEGCPGEITTPDKVPCLLLLPYGGDCSTQTIFIYNQTDLLYNQTLINHTALQCEATFNQTSLGSYSFLYSTGDTGNIIIEVNSMIDIFHVIVYGLFAALGLIFLVMMHIFKEDNTSMVYGALSSVIWLLLAVINISGFELIRDLVFIVDINYYVVFLSVVLCLYTGIISYFFYKENYKPQIDPYALRK